MKRKVLCILFLISTNIYAQQQRLLSFDLMSGILDTLEIPDFDTTKLHEQTTFCTGSQNDYFNILNCYSPTDNIYPGSNFSTKRQASKDYDINKFPIRTSVKLFKWENDSLKSKCSGSLISRKHVLTACHCVAKENIDSLLYDSLFVCPVLDNGEINSNFDCSWVKKIFFFENWNMSNTDFAVLELEKPIGENTGWISIGYDSNDSSLLDGIYYKFSYPATTILSIDSSSYNGDTLYYCYGIADIAKKNSFGVRYANGIPGESGSSLIKVENEKIYTSYGVFSYSNNLNHSRLTQWKYYSLKSVIIDDLELSIDNVHENNAISIFPNPTSDYLNINCSKENVLYKIELFDVNGIKKMEMTNLTNEIQLDLSNLPHGIYILIANTEKGLIVKKVIKYGR